MAVSRPAEWHRYVRLLTLVVLLAWVLTPAISPQATALAQSPQVWLDPATSTAGATVSIGGDGFPASSEGKV